MILEEYLRPELVVADLAASDKEEVLVELLDCVVRADASFDAKTALSVLLERERLGTTGIGDEVAIPHGKLEGLEKLIIVVGRSQTGVAFAALDHKPCRVFFLVLAPADVAGLHLRVLARISRLLTQPGFKESFLAAADAKALWNLLYTA